jgi:hypothetical protein
MEDHPVEISELDPSTKATSESIPKRTELGDACEMKAMNLVQEGRFSNWVLIDFSNKQSGIQHDSTIHKWR